MTTKNYYEGISHVVHVSNDDGNTCEHCDYSLGTDNIAKSINHYVETHQYKLLHVGQETSHDTNGNQFQLTVALLGK